MLTKPPPRKGGAFSLKKGLCTSLPFPIGGLHGRGVQSGLARNMPKKPKQPKNNSQESTLGPFARAVSEIDPNRPVEDKPADTLEATKPAEPGSGGDGGAASEGEGEVGKGEAPPEGETPQEGG
jgi:hypothetical protein